MHSSDRGEREDTTETQSNSNPERFPTDLHPCAAEMLAISLIAEGRQRNTTIQMPSSYKMSLKNVI